MSTKATLILNKEQIFQKSKRIAYQIIEDNFDEKEIVLVGIADRGYVFAQRLKNIIEELVDNKEVILIKVTIKKNKRSLEAVTDLPIETAANRAVIVVDDVLNSGRTLAYALGAFINVPLKKMRTAVLIDRSHHQFPIFSDYYGQKLSTILKENVRVYLEEFDNKEDAAWLE
ncbi:pyrimidine operon attenuation protein/uracil phosphoribosyltransferase [Sphingobacterium alimentarium]|uniref:Pyrimidine operon attenuation protein/uracil phosphoribosyltransferase n=1 Tax=Sphingobacterium alimentarium TaxID=797292 RepID=A0A4R3VYC0_9SPHI|nr:phosphoribosyltransferase family protein [Sphingobacterium alimentarium]TCV18721.1 pyrimidine operon attenuation protein/uracil phosphoribosyltransferase [Sphingobacterium alimentarium]